MVELNGPGPPEAAYDLRKLWFLVVDDNPHMLRLLETMLRGLGASNIVSHKDAGKALESEFFNGVDIIICDWNMAPVSSTDFVRRIRAKNPNPIGFTPIIMMSGFTQISGLQRARDDGVTEFISLPMSPKVLYERIVYAIEHPRPFVDSPNYFGPDRRRQTKHRYSGEERRQNAPQTIEVSDEKSPIPNLAQSG